MAAEHRSDADTMWVILGRAAGGEADEGEAGARLLAAAEAARAALGPAWSPVAAPAQEVSAWTEEHLLFLLPQSAHDEVASRLTDDAIDAAVIGIRARLTSPLFVASGEEPRRDLLGLPGLLGARGAALGRARAEPGRDAAEATGAGDLLAGDGQSLLLEARATEAPSRLRARLEAAIGGAATLTAIGPAAREEAAAAVTAAELKRLPVVALALLMIVLALGLRSARAAIGQGLCAGTGLLVGLAAGPPDLLGLPLLVLALGFGCEGMIHLQRIAAHGWAAPLILAGALAPALLAPYPAWHGWAALWAAIAAATLLCSRLALPAALGGVSIEAVGKGLSLRAWPIVSVLVASSLFAGGALALPALRAQGPAPLAIGDAALAEAEAAARARFFDPDGALTLRSRGADREAALEAAAAAATLAIAAPPGSIRRFDLPGALVVPADELARRAEGLRALAIPERIAALKEALRAAGLRPGAFGELLRGAQAVEDPPSAAAALAGPLGGWIAGHVREEAGGATLTSRIFVEPGADLAAIDEGGALGLRGPRAAAAADRLKFDDRLGLCAAMLLWLGALVVWLALRSLAAALAAGLTALAGLCGALCGLWALGRPLGPALLPALLLVGAAGMIAGGRACRSIAAQQPLLVRGLIVTSACQAAAAAALLTARVPMWRAMGEVVAIGAALAPALAVLVTPGLYAMFQRALGEGRAAR